MSAEAEVIEEFDPWAYPREAEAPVSKTFKDPRHPERRVRVTLVRIQDDVCAMTAALGEADELMTLHVTGTDDKPAVPFPAPEPIELSARLIQNVCILRRMQPAAERKSLLWWFGLAKHQSRLFTQIANWGLKLNRPNSGDASAEDVEGNPPAA